MIRLSSATAQTSAAYQIKLPRFQKTATDCFGNGSNDSYESNYIATLTKKKNANAHFGNGSNDSYESNYIATLSKSHAFKKVSRETKTAAASLPFF